MLKGIWKNEGGVESSDHIRSHLISKG